MTRRNVGYGVVTRLSWPLETPFQARACAGLAARGHLPDRPSLAPSRRERVASGRDMLWFLGRLPDSINDTDGFD